MRASANFRTGYGQTITVERRGRYVFLFVPNGIARLVPKERQRLVSLLSAKKTRQANVR